MDRAIKNNIISVLTAIDQGSTLNLMKEVTPNMFLCYDEFLGYLAEILPDRYPHLSFTRDHQPNITYSMANVGHTYCAILSNFYLDNYYSDLKMYDSDTIVFTFYTSIYYNSIIRYLFPFLPNMSKEILGYDVDITDDGYTIACKYSNYRVSRDGMIKILDKKLVVAASGGNIAFISGLLEGAELYCPSDNIRAYIAVQFKGSELNIVFDTECDATIGDLPKKYWPTRE